MLFCVILCVNFIFNSIMDVIELISRYYDIESDLGRIYMVHAQKVTDFALEMAGRHPELELDLDFIKEAAMLHDIGVFLTDAPRIHCHGSAPYICHGYLGAELLRKEGLPRHALVSERHTGTGLTAERIKEQGWPLPHIDMRPVSLEEQLICFADKFYSKTKHLYEARSLEQVVESMRKISEESANRILEWQALFG